MTRILSIALLIPLFSSCFQDNCSKSGEVFRYEGVFEQASDFRTDVTFESSRAFVNPGKIYKWGDYVFVNELREGIHVIDNSDPVNPVNTGFLTIPGNLDIAIRDHILYADSYLDLLAVDVSQLEQPRIICRQEGVFPHYGVRDDGAFLVYYKEELVTETIPCERNLRGFAFGANEFFIENTSGQAFQLSEAMVSRSADARASTSSNTGAGGSTARFTLAADRLFSVHETVVRSFSLSSDCPEALSETELFGTEVETIFSDGRYLFLGANNGMHILTLDDKPEHLSSFSHNIACDPVVVEGDFAYVTLRNGVETRCGGWRNQLEQIGISDVYLPQRIRTVDMANPHGLTVGYDRLVVCEGVFGIKVFDLSDPNSFADRLMITEEGFHAYDVLNGNRPGDYMVIGDDGLYQYRLDEDDGFELLSHMSLTP